LLVVELAFPTRTTVVGFDSAKSNILVLENWGLQYMPVAGDRVTSECRMPPTSPKQEKRIPPAAEGFMKIGTVSSRFLSV
jgi:hypothetical protein